MASYSGRSNGPIRAEGYDLEDPTVIAALERVSAELGARTRSSHLRAEVLEGPRGDVDAARSCCGSPIVGGLTV
ncbi:MAG TPA: hypothetical protein VG327_06095 [Mycobacterium sp.]|nr:hypothetical protein [Mycobacterium sp.]